MYFNDEKVAQMSAYFLMKRGGRMSHLKLMKLLYLADRESMDQIDEPITADVPVSMKNGPVLSQTYDLMKGETPSAAWQKWVADIQDHEVTLRAEISDREDLDELSDFDIEILEKVWAEHGHKTRWNLVDFTHERCAEWRDPGYSSVPIDPKSQFFALGRPIEQAERLRDYLLERRQLGHLWKELS